MPEVRLIDAIELVRYLCGACPSNQNGECIDKMCWKYEDRARIENAPTIEAEPVQHGRWAKAADKQYCTNCRAVTKVLNAPFCWHCGAQMDFRTPTEVQLDEADSVMMGSADNG